MQACGICTCSIPISSSRPCVQGEIVRLEQHTVDLADENAALRAESDRLEARDAALQGYGLDDMHNDQLSQLILTLTQVWAENTSAVTGKAKGTCSMRKAGHLLESSTRWTCSKCQASTAQPAWGVQGWYHELQPGPPAQLVLPNSKPEHDLRQLIVQAVERVRITVQLRRLQAAAQASAEPPQPENGEVPSPAPDSFARPPPDESALKSPFVLASARTSSEQPSQDLLTKSSSGRFNPDGGNADRLAALRRWAAPEPLRTSAERAF